MLWVLEMLMTPSHEHAGRLEIWLFCRIDWRMTIQSDFVPTALMFSFMRLDTAFKVCMLLVLLSGGNGGQAPRLHVHHVAKTHQPKSSKVWLSRTMYSNASVTVPTEPRDVIALPQIKHLHTHTSKHTHTHTHIDKTQPQEQPPSSVDSSFRQSSKCAHLKAS